jgi:O-antigen/teichoic acid export membrane protein
MSNSNRIVKNVIANWLGLAVNMAVAVFMAPFLVHQLGDALYGLWVLLLSVTGYMGLLDAGLRVSVVKHVARHHAIDDVPNVSRIISTAFAIYAGLGVLIVCISVVAGPFVPRIFSMPAEAASTARVVLVITSTTIAVSLLLSVFNGLLAGLQRYDHTNRIGAGLVILRSIVIVLLVSSGFGIVALGLTHLASQLAGSLLTVRRAFKEVPGLQVRWSLVGGGTAKTLYSYSFFILLNNMAMFLLFNSAEIVIGAMMSVASITYYAIAGSLLQYLSRLIGTMTQVLHPYASAQEARGDTEGVRRIVIHGTKACLLIALPIGVTFMLIGKDFIRFWMGPSYAEVAAPLLVFCTIGRLFWLSQSSTGNVLLGIGRHKILTAINLVTGIAGLGLGAVLIRPMGLLGMAVGMCIPMVLTQGFVLPPLTARVFKMSLAQYWREAYAPPLLAVVPYGVLLFMLLATIKPVNLVVLALDVVLALPALLFAVYFVCFTAPERRMFWDRYQTWLPLGLASSRR